MLNHQTISYLSCVSRSGWAKKSFSNFLLRYYLWKKGLHPYPSDIISHAVPADRNRDELVRGKTKDEVRSLFPDVYESLDDYQKRYEKELSGRDYLWLGKYGVIN